MCGSLLGFGSLNVIASTTAAATADLITPPARSLGNFADAAKHLATAVQLYSDPPALLQVLQKNMPPQAFGMVMQQLQAAQR